MGPTDEHGNVTIDSFVARGISACEDVIETADLETKSFAVDELLHVSYSATAFCYAGFDSGGYELSGEPKGDARSHGGGRYMPNRPNDLLGHRRATLATLMDGLGGSYREFVRYTKSEQQFNRLLERYEDYCAARMREPMSAKQPNRAVYDTEHGGHTGVGGSRGNSRPADDVWVSDTNGDSSESDSDDESESG